MTGRGTGTPGETNEKKQALGTCYISHGKTEVSSPVTNREALYTSGGTLTRAYCLAHEEVGREGNRI
jgi:hypothetical protein